jgi:murein DD-endopeptidase MepM/ murein hydrolase activator NlpD
MFRMSFLEVSGLVSKARNAFRTVGASIASATIGLSLFATAQIANAAPMVAPATAMIGTQDAATTSPVQTIGIAPHQLHGRDAAAVGGPFEPIDTTAARNQPDPQFRALFQSWKRLDQSQQGTIAIPSLMPITSFTAFSSGFGVRSDPFRGSAAMHPGVDMPGPIGTSVYATADGVVSRSEWAGGYGNLVEIDHGRGIQTRYGHLSASLVHAGQRIKRGQLIARMGSTGRSTGSHLHYEVRLDGHAVNPMPFLQSATYLAAIPAHGGNKQLAMGGPAQ